LWANYREARVLAFGGLEVLRMGLIDVSCQICWASDSARSAQVARVMRNDLNAVMRRLQDIRNNLPAWQPCIPRHWHQVLAGTRFPIDLNIRSAGVLGLRQWLESTALSMTAAMGEYTALIYTLSNFMEFGETSDDMILEGKVKDAPFPNQPPARRGAVLIQGCAQLSYPKIDLITVGKEDCTQIWRKFEYADASTSVVLPQAFVRVVADTIPSTEMLSFVHSAVETPPTTDLALPPGLRPAPTLQPFDRSVLDRPVGTKSVVFLCQHTAMCGGHGDRLFGLLSAYLAARLAGRSFFIDMRSPIPLASVLAPKKPWPAVTTACVTYRWTSAENLTKLDEDILRFLSDDSDVVCIVSNVRLFSTLLQHDSKREFSRAGLLSGLFLDLFSLAPVATSLLVGFSKQLQGRTLLGIHFRAGNESTWGDPPRHGISDLQQALMCAKGVEESLGLHDAGTAWLLAADTAKV